MSAENPSCAPGGGVSAQWLRIGFAVLVAAQSMVFGLAVNLSPPQGTARTVLHSILAGSAVLVFLLVGIPLLREGARQAVRGKIVVEQLFLLGIFGAFFASLQSTIVGRGSVYYEIVAVLLAIYTFGSVVGQRRRDAAMQTADALGREFSTCARVTRCGQVEEVSIDEIAAGDRVLVRAGDGMPVDGVVREGTAFVREAALTGEPFPVVKRAGDKVLAGSYVLDQSLTIESICAGRGRMLDRMLEAVREARLKPSSLQREADRLVAIFLPIVVTASALTFAFWTWRSGWLTGSFNALAVLLVACPCAMGLATPIGNWSALAALARRGVVPRDSDFIQGLSTVDTVVFDKTGTLSESELAVVDFITLPGVDRALLQNAIAALERGSNHPVARAFHGWTVDSTSVANDVTLLAGIGVQGTVNGHALALGNIRLVEAGDAEGEKQLRALIASETKISHELFVKFSGKLVAVALLRERFRESAPEALRVLQKAGIEPYVMTGDRQAQVDGVPEANRRAGLSSEDKAELVRDLQAQGKRVLFVGDGVNDALALGEAHASMALASGAGLAKESAQAQLFGHDLSSITDALAICRQITRAIRQNLIFAFFYNLLGITLAALGLLHPVAAALIMLAASVSVTWRALRQGENAQQMTPMLSTRPAKKKALRVGWKPVALVGAALLQIPFLIYLSQATVLLALKVTLGGVLVIAVCVALWRVLPRKGAGRMVLGMGAYGNLAMLIGWWADAGFAPVIREGACICGCPKSSLGLGLLAGLSWMKLSMIPASLPMIGFFENGARARRIVDWFVTLAAMVFGMQFGAWGMSKIFIQDGTIHFFLTFGAMTAGMLLFMLAACRCQALVKGATKL